MVDIRMSKPEEHFYKSLLDPNRGYAWKQDLNRLTKRLPRMTVCSFLYAFGVKERTEEDFVNLGESKKGLDYRIVYKTVLSGGWLCFRGV